MRGILLKQEGQIELLSKPIKENPHLKHFGGNTIPKKSPEPLRNSSMLKMCKTLFFAN
jgi:hypothetical protein|tara:strand:- start:55 stop:228 length:174 start_codon:yes stop_codon:yes gene_type:complete